jgi:hypothetical protein
MGWVYKRRATPPDELSLMHSKIARGLDIDPALVKRILPEERRSEAEDICNDLFLMESEPPSLMAMAGMLNGALGVVLAQGVNNNITSTLLGCVSLSLVVYSYLYGQRDVATRVEAGRHDTLKKFFEIATRDDNKQALPLPIKRDKPFWRDEKVASPDHDPI